MSDWRLQGQEDYLQGVELCWAPYKPYSETWEHDHCEFCWAKFSLREGDLKEGYATPDRYRWICKACYDDFKDVFAWRVVPGDALGGPGTKPS